MTLLELLKSKTFWGALLLAVSVVLQAEPITSQKILEAVGILLGGVGIRTAIARGPTL